MTPTSVKMIELNRDRITILLFLGEVKRGSMLSSSPPAIRQRVCHNSARNSTVHDDRLAGHKSCVRTQ